MPDNWTLTRSRLANAARRLRTDGPSPEAEAAFKTAEADHAAARLELAIGGVLARGILIPDVHKLQLIELLTTDPSPRDRGLEATETDAP